MSSIQSQSARFSRRTLMGASLASAAAIGPLTSIHHASARGVPHATLRPASLQEASADPANWRTWLMASADELRPDAPGAPSQAEIDEIVDLQANPSDEMTAAIQQWGGSSPVITWSRLANEVSAEFGIGGLPQGRFLAIFHTALHDAVVAAWDAQVAHGRPSPGATSDAIVPAAGVNPAQSSFPSEHAVLAGAAAAVLTYLLPDAEAGRFDALANEAAEPRIAAGAAFRSDVEIGLALGRSVGELAVTRAQGDGSTATWDPATRRTGPGHWEPTPPAFVETPAAPMAGFRKTWVMTSGDQFRPMAPPAYGSAAWKSELETVLEIADNLTFEQARAATWWASQSPPGLLSAWTHELLSREGTDIPRSAKILADLHVAIDDGLISVWDAKYTWWTSRPVTEAPELKTVVPSPPYPAYPSGYSSVMGAGTTVIGHYFPDTMDDMAVRAWEATCSRGWAGIHYLIDDDIGFTMGRQVGRLVCSLDRANPT